MFADFRIANSQGTGCLKTADQEIHNHTVKDHPSRTRQSPTSTIIDRSELAYRAREEHRLRDGAGPAFSRDS